MCAGRSPGSRRHGRGRLATTGAPLAWAQLAAGGFDAIENTALLAILAGRGGHLPALACTWATTKFALLTAGWTYCLLAF